MKHNKHDPWVYPRVYFQFLKVCSSAHVSFKPMSIQRLGLSWGDWAHSKFSAETDCKLMLDLENRVRCSFNRVKMLRDSIPYSKGDRYTVNVHNADRLHYKRRWNLISFHKLWKDTATDSRVSHLCGQSRRDGTTVKASNTGVTLVYITRDFGKSWRFTFQR